MDEAFITAPFYPPSDFVKGIVVNKEGKRFVAEDSYHSRTSYNVMRQPAPPPTSSWTAPTWPSRRCRCAR